MLGVNPSATHLDPQILPESVVCFPRVGATWEADFESTASAPKAQRLFATHLKG